MWVKCIIRKISDCYLKLPYEQTLIVSHFSRILLTDSKIKDKIVNFKKISKSVCILPTYVLYIHIYIYIYQQARVSSFPGPISVSRVDE